MLRLLVIQFVVVSHHQQTPPLTSDYSVIHSPWSVAAKCIALAAGTVHSTKWSHILAQKRDSCWSGPTPPGPARRRNSSVKEWCFRPDTSIVQKFQASNATPGDSVAAHYTTNGWARGNEKHGNIAVGSQGIDALWGRLKMREWKMRHGHNCRGGKCRSKPHGYPTWE